MSSLGMSDLVAAMVAAGGPSCTDAREHWQLHAALVGLGERAVGSSALPPLAGSPDPDVGLRVEGVTRALWSLVGSGLFRVEERQGGADLIVQPDGLPAARRVLMRLGDADRDAVYLAANFWACASTARKNRASAAGSSVGTRDASEANCRQSTVPARRQRAVKASSPA